MTLKLPALDGVYVFVPDVAVEPIEGEPLHAVALVDDQLSSTLSPRVIELSSNDALTVGGPWTVTLAVSLPLPPAPVHVTLTLNVPALVGVYVFVPDVAVEPMPGDPSHELALLDDQVSSTLSPSAMELPSNDALTVGGAWTVTLALSLRLPPSPVHVTVTLNVPALDGVYVLVPDVAVEPIDGEPLHELALLDDQVSSMLSPSAMELSSNDASTSGASGGGSLTVTLASSLPLPPGPVQVTVTLKVPALDGVYSFVPEVDVEPIAGEPLHAVAFSDDQLSSTLSPRVMELSSNSASTSGGAWTVTLAVALPLPPAPVHVTLTLNVPALDGVYVFVPEVDVEPIAGEPLHAVALVDDQLSSTLAPSAMELSSNDASTVGGAWTVTLAVALPLPPSPVQVTVTLNVPALDGVYVLVPEVDVEPIAGEPLHELALLDDQVSSTLSPSLMELSSNDALTVGDGGLTVTVSAVKPDPKHISSSKMYSQ